MEPQLAALVIEDLKRAHVRFVVGLPDSMLAGVYVTADKDPDIKYVSVTNEAEGASVGAGAWITCLKPHRSPAGRDYFWVVVTSVISRNLESSLGSIA